MTEKEKVCKSFMRKCEICGDVHRCTKPAKKKKSKTYVKVGDHMLETAQDQFELGPEWEEFQRGWRF